VNEVLANEVSIAGKGPESGPELWRPSEYTALLLHVLQTRSRHLVRGAVLELGVGSGLLLSAMGRLGASRLVGTDIDPRALAAARGLLAKQGQTAELLAGDVWEPLQGRCFALIVANPPQFPMTTTALHGRAPTWSNGGHDGRRVLDPLLRGLRAHLEEGGHALLAHNAFLGLARTRQLLAEQGLGHRRLGSALVPLSPEKRAIMTPAVVAGAQPGTLHQIGGHCFARVDILMIAARVRDAA
jgi:release factor glutamine methyltransferase